MRNYKRLGESELARADSRTTGSLLASPGWSEATDELRPNEKLSDCRETGAPGATKGNEYPATRNGKRLRQFAGAES